MSEAVKITLIKQYWASESDSIYKEPQKIIVQHEYETQWGLESDIVHNRECNKLASKISDVLSDARQIDKHIDKKNWTKKQKDTVCFAKHIHVLLEDNNINLD